MHSVLEGVEAKGNTAAAANKAAGKAREPSESSHLFGYFGDDLFITAVAHGFHRALAGYIGDRWSVDLAAFKGYRRGLLEVGFVSGGHGVENGGGGVIFSF